MNTVVPFPTAAAPDATDPEAVAFLARLAETAGPDAVSTLATGMTAGWLDVPTLRPVAIDLPVLLRRHRSPVVVAARTGLPVAIVEAWRRGLPGAA